MRSKPAPARSEVPSTRFTNFFVLRFKCLPLPLASRVYSNIMQNKKLVKAIIWIVVISMVLALVVSVIAFL